MTSWVSQSLKAIYAGVAAGLSALSVALVEAHTFGNISDASWITVGTAIVLSFGAVYGVTNAPPAPKP